MSTTMNQLEPRPDAPSSSLPVALAEQHASETNIHDLTDAARRLRAVTSHINSFLTGQLQRLSDAMHVFTQVKAEAETVRRLFAELENERQQWQAQRTAELDRLQQASESLVEAWERLDAQQRQLLIDQRRNDPARPSVVVCRAPNLGSSNGRTGTMVRMPEKMETTLLEIQMLKQEMLSHAQRRK